MKNSTVLSGVAHNTRVNVIAPSTAIGILVPLVAMSTKLSVGRWLAWGRPRFRGRLLEALTADETK